MRKRNTKHRGRRRGNGAQRKARKEDEHPGRTAAREWKAERRSGWNTFEDALREVNEHPEECFRAAGFNVPKEIMGDQQKTVIHLIRSGQVGGPMMRMIAPLLNRSGIKI